MRRRIVRTTSALASTGLLVGFGVSAAAVPAFAATDADCTDANSLASADGDDAADIQALLDDDGVSVICLTGTFPVTATLTANRDITLYGLPSAVLDGLDTNSILVVSGEANTTTLQNLTFENGSGSNGAAVNAYTVIVENSIFQSNEAAFGGAIFSYDVTVTDSQFLSNTADSGDGFGFGGAIMSYGSAVVTDSIFTLNEAELSGGAITSYDSVEATGSTFTSNYASAVGGAILGEELVDVSSSTFTQNEAEFGGAITGYEQVTVGRSTFVDNFSAYGGAINSDDVVSVVNSTFVDNEATDEGGAIYAGTGTVGFSTFLNNTAAEPVDGEELPGEAIYLEFDGEDDLEIRGNIFAGTSGNPQLGVGTVVEPTAIVDRGGNVFSTSEATEADLNDPAESTLFSQSISAIFGASPALDDNGGSTETVALVPSSPAVDAVPPLVDVTLAPASLLASIDQRGEPKAGEFVDAGAFELQDDELGGEGAELADTGPDDTKASLLGGFAALFIGIGAAFAIGTRRISRNSR